MLRAQVVVQPTKRATLGNLPGQFIDAREFFEIGKKLDCYLHGQRILTIVSRVEHHFLVRKSSLSVGIILVQDNLPVFRWTHQVSAKSEIKYVRTSCSVVSHVFIDRGRQNSPREHWINHVQTQFIEDWFLLR